jgi:hypothetical protein
MKHANKRTKNAGNTRKITKSRQAPQAPQAAVAAPKPTTPTPTRAPRERDPRIPAAGTTLVRPYKGREYRVEVLEDGFRYDGTEYRSLSALASHITGFASVNGVLWFGLAKRPTPAAAAQTGA